MRLSLINYFSECLTTAEATPEGYKEIGCAQVIDMHGFIAPVTSNGFVFVRNNEGDVICIDI